MKTGDDRREGSMRILLLGGNKSFYATFNDKIIDLSFRKN